MLMRLSSKLTVALGLGSQGCFYQPSGSGHDEPASTASSSAEATTGPSSTSGTTPTDTTDGEVSSTDGEDGVCGDGIVDAQEACDEGEDNSDTSRCTSVCKLARCGDGHVRAGAEVCDDGQDNGLYSKCNDSCTAQGPRCGDGVTNGPEQCDDGNALDHDECSTKCVQAKYIFVTHDQYTGDIGGLALADLACQLQAPEFAKGTWKAWLSAADQAPANRFNTAFEGWYRTLDGQPVSEGWQGLTSGNLAGPLEFDVAGFPVAGEIVWTGSLVDGSGSGKHCSGWTTFDLAQVGTCGLAGHRGSSWTDAGWVSCESQARLYCIQQ